MDLMQAYHLQLLNDEELHTYEGYETAFTGLGMCMGAMVPLTLVYALKPETFAHLGDSRLRMAKVAFGLAGFGIGYLGYNQHMFLQNLS